MVAVREFRGDGAENLNISKLRHRHKTSDKNWVYSIFWINSMMTMIMPMMLKGEDNVDFVNEEDLDWGWRYQRRLDVDGNGDENDLNDN